MKIYTKILLITSCLQVMGFVSTRVLDVLISPIPSSSLLPLFVGMAFLFLSLVLGIALPIVWHKRIKEKILSILLLPTNYTWIVIAFRVIRFTSGIAEIMMNLSPIFG